MTANSARKYLAEIGVAKKFANELIKFDRSGSATFVEFLKMLSAYSNDFGVGHTGFVPLSLYSKLEMAASICYLRRHALLQKDDVFIELGSGLGDACFIATFLGLRAIGYEISDKLFEESCKRRDELVDTGFLNQNVNFVRASFFPNEYIKVIEHNKSLQEVVSTSETSLYLILGDTSVAHASVHDLGKGKFYYAFPWSSQREYMLRLFSLYAHPDAHFWIVGGSYYAVRKELRLRKHTNTLLREVLCRCKSHTLRTRRT